LSSIRVTYSGLIGFVIGLVSIVTGLIFVLVVTRRLSPEEFGIWSIIGNMVFYFLISERIVSYWTVREISRGKVVGKTAIMSSGALSIISIPIYIAVAFVISLQTNIDPMLMIFGALLVPVQFVSQTLVLINMGHKPHVKSYGLIIFEALKIPAGLALVYFLDLGVEGAIITIFLAYVGRIIVQYYFAKSKISGNYNFKIFKNWFKLSWIPLYSYLTNSIWTIDVVLYSLITHSVLGVAYYSAALTIAAIVKHSGMISQALYPKLLAKGNYQHIQDNFSRLLYFSIPLLGISIIFAKPALFALNPEYVISEFIVIILTIKMFFWVLRDVFDKILLGIETVDIENNLSFSTLSKSNLFFVPTRKLIHFIMYITTMTISLILLTSQQLPEIELVQTWALIGSVFEIPFFIYLLSKVIKKTDLSFPFKDVTKYIFGTIVFIIIYYITSPIIITYEISIFNFLPKLLIQLGICTLVYLLITYSIDKKTRNLTKSILNELKKK
jgi:O-antigen/teichoic acid export membrane protein